MTSEITHPDQFGFMDEQEQNLWYFTKAREVLITAQETNVDPLHAIDVAIDYLYYVTN